MLFLPKKVITFTKYNNKQYYQLRERHLFRHPMQVRIRIKSEARKDGQHLLMFDFHVNGKRKRVSTEIYVYPESWDSDHEEIKKSKKQFNHSGLNDLLQTKKKILINAYYTSQKDRNVSIDKILEIYNSVLNKETKKTEEQVDTSFLSFFEIYKYKFRNIKSKETLRKGDQVYLRLMEYNPNLNWEDLTDKFWIDYTDWLIEEHGLSGATILKHGNEISIRCKEASKIYKNIDIPEDHNRFKFKYFETQPFWLNWEEVQGISKALTLTEVETHVRDNFIFTCNTGLRNSDSYIRKSNYFTDKGKHYLRVVQEKTNFDYNIQLNKQAMSILSKYNFQLPVHAQGTHNLYIKNIARRVKPCREKYEKVTYKGIKKFTEPVLRAEMISTHTARRTFARHWLNNQGSLVILSKMLGHSSTEQTLRYAGFTPQEVSQEFDKVFNMG